MNRLAIVLLGLTVAAGRMEAASPDPKTLQIPPSELVKARSLVHKLGSEIFRDREQAQVELARMGRLARPALVEAMTADPSPEVRSRTARLLPKAEAADLQARIDTFLADTDGKYQHDLPAWSIVRKEVGADRPARELYVEALRSPANLELLIALGTSPEAGGRAVADRRMGLFLEMNPGAFGRMIPGGPTRPRQPTLADIAILLLSEAVVPSKDIPRPGAFGHITGAQFIQQQVAMNAINNSNGPHADAYRRILVKWIDSRTTPDELNNIAYIANNFRGKIKETDALLRRIVTTEGVQPHAKAQGMIFLSQRGKEELPTIRSQLKNETALNQRMQIAPNVLIDSQIRDVALLLTLRLEDQDIAKALKEYGFTTQPGFNPAQVTQNFWGYGFTTDEARTAAFKKWAAYEAKKGNAPGDEKPPEKK